MQTYLSQRCWSINLSINGSILIPLIRRESPDSRTPILLRNANHIVRGLSRSIGLPPFFGWPAAFKNSSVFHNLNSCLYNTDCQNGKHLTKWTNKKKENKSREECNYLFQSTSRNLSMTVIDRQLRFLNWISLFINTLSVLYKKSILNRKSARQIVCNIWNLSNLLFNKM